VNDDHEQLSFRLDWTPEILRGLIDAAWGGGRSSLKKFLTWFAWAAVFAWILFAAVRSDNWIILFLLVFVATPLVSRWWAKERWVKGELSSRLRHGTTTLTLGPNGIDADHPLSTEHYEWEAVQNIIEGKQALHLMLTPTTALPIPYSDLPAGMTREDLRQRIDLWRVGGTF